MILDRLIDLRDRLPDDGAVPEAHKSQSVRWVLDVSADGRVTGLTETGGKRGQAFTTPYFVRQGTGAVPFLLVDKPEYVLGMVPPGGKPERVAKLHTAYLDLLKEARDATGDARIASVYTALSSPDEAETARRKLAEHDWKAGDLILPSVAGAFPHDDKAVRQFWVDRQGTSAADKSGFVGACLHCGETKPIARTHPVELQVGPDRVGLVTGNASAFLSHGLVQSEIAPMCQDCARAYGEALRFLLQSPDHHLRLSGAAWLFWTREPVPDFNPAGLFSDPTPSDVARVLTAARTGHLPDVDVNAFYALVVSSNKSRLVVRDWLAVPLSETMKALAAYFEGQRMAGYDGEDKPLKLIALAGATVRDLKDLQPQTTDALLAHALTGRPLPVVLLHQALMRARADEHPVTRPRAALIRLVLRSLALTTHRPDLMADAALNPDHPEPAYHCGRLLAVLDALQRKAISPNATLVDRFYGAASTTPALVFGTLLRKAQPHVAKLRTGRGDPWLDRRLGEIAARIPAFPTTLTPVEQGLFALGFYQEKYRPYEGKPDAPAADAPDDSTDA